MPRSPSARLLLCAALLLAGGCDDCSEKSEPAAAPSETARREGPPSVLLVTLDTTRRDRIGVYGYEHDLSPNIDRLGGEGAVFMDARTEVPITLPSHATILTGQGIREHGVRENGAFVVTDEAVTLAEVLSDDGFETAAFVSSFVLDSQFGLEQGFDEYDDEMTGVTRRSWHGQRVDKFERRGNETAERVLSWLEGRSADRPYFAWVHFYDPHQPYRPPKKFRKDGWGRYAAEVAFMDHHLGRVVDAAREHDPSTLVVVASDHGESLGEHGIHGHGSDIYDPAMRAVLVMSHPELVPKGVTPEQRVRLTAVAPTIVDLLGVDANIAGQSLKPLLEGEEVASADPLYMETIVPALRFDKSGVHGLLDGPDKLIYWPDADRTELYDLAEDPAEKNDLSGERPERASELRATLEERMETMGGEDGSSEEVEMSDETVDKLRALGYVE